MMSTELPGFTRIRRKSKLAMSALCFVEGGVQVRRRVDEFLEFSFHLSDGDFVESATGYDLSLRKILPTVEVIDLSGDILGDEEVFRSGDAHHDLLQFFPASCGFLFLDSASLARLWARVVFFLEELFEMSVSDQNFNSILHVDALFGYITVSLVVPAKLAFVL
ncbi:hypothetical protein A2U01_0045451, partial [Trifolium medium]|nr:hypothetical protein [Trifolium medium]